MARTSTRKSKPDVPTKQLDAVRGSVVVEDGFGAEYPIARVDVMGQKAALYWWDQSSGGWEMYDQLTHGEQTISASGVVTFTGRSKLLANQIDTDDDHTIWIVTPKGCQDCG